MRAAELVVAGASRSERERSGGSHHAHQEVAALVSAVRSGDQAAWDGLVDRFSPMLWAVARGVGLNAADASDVCQTTWLRLLESLPAIEQPERVSGWLATTVRREAIRTSQRAARTLPTDEERVFDAMCIETPPEPSTDELFARELQTAVAELPERSRSLIAMLLVDPPLPYSEISDVLAMPVGSIGPTRARIFAAVRTKLERRGISGCDLASE